MSLRCAPRVWKWSLLGSLCLIVASWANPEISIDLPDGTPMEFIWVEPGTFKMGMTSEQKKGIANHRGVDFASMMPAHRVTISTGFYLGKYEVTQAQWRAVMNRLPDPDVEQNPDLPVLVIDLNDLEQFLFRMSDAMDGGLVRLPTEAEWEYACRAGTTTLWWFGDTEFVGENLRPFMWYHANACRDSGESVKPCYANPVGRKRPNPWGFHDMHGNLEELTADRSLRDYAIYSVTDPMSQEPDPDFGGRVARGGGTAGGNISSAKQLITTSAFRVIQGSGGIRLLLVMPEEGLRASAGVDRWAVAGQSNALDGSASIGESLSFEWSEHEDNPEIGLLSGRDSVTASFIPTLLGIYRFSLTVTDSHKVSEPDEIVLQVVAVSADGSVRVPIFDDVTMDFVWIESGVFTRGITQEQEEIMRHTGLWYNGNYGGMSIASQFSQPAHEAILTEGFYLGKHEVTQAQWTAILGTKPWTEQLSFSYAEDYEYLDDPQLPANMVQWGEVDALLTRLNPTTGRRRYDLPTEAQWEYAALAGSSGLWSFGYAAEEIGDYTWFDHNVKEVGLNSPQPVGLKSPNRFGLYDMDGNVKEWCLDYFERYDGDDHTDPAGPTFPPGGRNSRSQRGGDFRTPATSSRERFSSPATTRRDNVGARLLLYGPKLPDPVGVPLHDVPDFTVPVVPEPVEIPAREEPTILFLDETFDGESASGWVEQTSTDWHNESGVYRLTGGGDVSVAYFPSPVATNYTIDVRIQVRQGEGWILFSRADDQPRWRLGLYSDNSAARLESIRLVASQELHTTVQPIPPPPEQRLHPGQEGWFLPWPINQNRWYDVRIAVRTSTFDVYVDDELIHRDVTLGHALANGVIGIGGAPTNLPPNIDIARVRLWHGYGLPELEAFADVGEDAILPDSVDASEDKMDDIAQGLTLEIAPNPVLIETTISYEHDSATLPTLSIYDISGQRVWSQSLSTRRGSVLWNKRDQHGQKVSSGVYFVRLHGGDRQQTRRLLVLH